MTLHTTPDGQITYEGLPVVNQEEVRLFLCGGNKLNIEKMTIQPGTDYELPDEEFEAYKVFRGKKVRILRKPVSEEGEKNYSNDYIHDWQDQMTVAAGIEPQGEKNKRLWGSSSLDDRKEFIICSAIWFIDDIKHEHQPKNINTGFVVCGRRHHNCYVTAFILHGEDRITKAYSELKRSCIQGFLTNTDRFVDRKEGYSIAKSAGQLIHNLHDMSNPILTSECLYSEDIY